MFFFLGRAVASKDSQVESMYEDSQVLGDWAGKTL